MEVNAPKLDAELRAAGIPIEGCASTGRIDFAPEATEKQRQQAAAVLAAHDPTPTVVPSLEEQVAALQRAVLDLAMGA